MRAVVAIWVELLLLLSAVVVVRVVVGVAAVVVDVGVTRVMVVGGGVVGVGRPKFGGSSSIGVSTLLSNTIAGFVSSCLEERREGAGIEGVMGCIF